MIGANAGGIPHLLTDGVEGFLVEPHDADQFVDRISQLAADPTCGPGWRLRPASRTAQLAQRNRGPDRLLRLAVWHQITQGPFIRQRVAGPAGDPGASVVA